MSCAKKQLIIFVDDNHCVGANKQLYLWRNSHFEEHGLAQLGQRATNRGNSRIQ